MGKKGKKGGKDEELMSKKAQPPNKKQEPEKEQEFEDINLEEIDNELRTERTPGLFSLYYLQLLARNSNLLL